MIKALSSLSSPYINEIMDSSDSDDYNGTENDSNRNEPENRDSVIFEDRGDDEDDFNIPKERGSSRSKRVLRLWSRNRSRLKKDIWNRNETAEDENENYLDPVLKWKGDRVSWICIMILVSEIQKLTNRLHPVHNLNPANSVNNPTSSVLKTFSGDISKNNRLDEIIKATPELSLVLRREELASVLFDQIRTIGLSYLEPLLEVIRGLMLRGHVPPELYFEPKFDLTLLLSTADDSELNEQGNDATPLDTRGTMDSSKISSHDQDFNQTGMGVVADPDTSNVWKLLIESVGYSKGLDHLRKERCIEWYLYLRHEAKVSYENAKKKSKLSKKGLDQVQDAAGVSRQHLRAKL